MNGSITFNDKRYYSLAGAAELLGVSARDLEQRFLRGEVAGRRIGAGLYLEAEALYRAREASPSREAAPHAVSSNREIPAMPVSAPIVHEEPRIVSEVARMRPRAQAPMRPSAPAHAHRMRGVLTTVAAVVVVAVIPVAAAMAYPTMQRGVAALRTQGPRAMTSIHLPQFGSIGSFFAGMRSQLASVFVLGEVTPTGDVATTTPPLSASKVLAQNALNTFDSTSTVSSSTPSTSVQPIYYVYNYPVIERIKYEAPGISASSTSDYDTKLQELYNKIEQQILVLSETSSTQNAQTYQVIAQTNRIDQLASVHVSSSNISGGTITGASISGGSYSGSVDASTLNAGSTTLATTTINGDLNLTGSLNFSGSSSTISATAAVLNNATTTNLFSTLAHFTTGIIDTLSATAANITGLTATNSTTTNATSTNLFATNLSASTASTTNLVFTNATGSTMYLSGNATVGGNLTVNGNSITLGTSTSNSLVINSAIKSDLIPDQNITRDLGSASFYWRNAYVGTLNANNISAASTSIGGTASNDFTINSDNATADAETMNLIFFRGTVVPNALLTWNSAANKKRFEFNQAVAISNASASTTNPTFTLTGTAGQSANILQVASSTGTNIFTVGPNGDTAVSGNLTVGGTTNITGALSLTNASTSLLSVFQRAYFGGTATTTIDSAGNVIVAGNLNVNGNTTLANATSTTFALTGITSALLKTNGTGSVVAAAAGTDYAPATAGSSILLGNGSGGFSSYAGSSCTNQFVRSINGAGVATCATVSLTSDVTGILPIANGGTATSTGGNTNGVSYYNGSYLTNSANFTFNGSLLALVGNASTTQLTSTGSTYLATTGGNLFVGTTTLTGAGSLPKVLIAQNQGSHNSGLLIKNAAGTNEATIGVDSSGVAGDNGIIFRQGGTEKWAFGQLGSSVGATGYLYFLESGVGTSLTLKTGGTIALNRYGAGALSTDASGNVSASTLSIANGGTGTTTQVTNGVNYFDGTNITSGTALTFTGTNFGVGTTTPFRKLSVTDTVSAAQLAIAYDGTRYTQLQTDAAGDYHINPSGQDAQLDDSNLWVCSGGSCPAGAPTGTGNLIVENKLGVGTSSPSNNLDVYSTSNALTSTSTAQVLVEGNSNNVGIQLANYQTGGRTWGISSSGGSSGVPSAFMIYDMFSGASRLNIDASGNVGIGTTTPSKQLSVSSLIYVGANGATGMGTATSTFQGDIKITGKLDVGTIDPPYTIDGVKYATYGASTVGVHEEVVLKVTPTTYDAKRKLYDYSIDFSSLPKGSDAWLFYQVTDFGPQWENLVVTLTPGFDGRAFYEQDVAHHTLHILSDKEGPVSVRMIANRYDFTKWNNLRADQDGVTEGTHVISSKPSTSQAAAASAVQ